VIWCAFGAPRQELWMAAHAKELAPAVLVGVGAAFDFLSGEKARAPIWMQRSGLEWLHRLLHEPRRLAGRYVQTNTEFALRAVLEVTRGRGG
jgi:N-acetylglucosaminyldiphosphoundecaprenol N-acetyl-beta-D-mannosaminyltransferase